MIATPRSLEAALAALSESPAKEPAELRAGGTDLQHRRQLGISRGPVVELRAVPGLDTIEPTPEGGLRVGAGVRVAALAAHPLVRERYPGLATAAADLATPQIRAVATVGGNLLQRNRCWYFRNPVYTCLKRGGATCFAREGVNLHHAAFDLGPCVAPHPSTLALGFLAWDASAEVAGGLPRPVAEIYGDGSDPRRDHRLDDGEILQALLLPPPPVGEQSAYLRVSSRALAEWPLVDVLVRLVVREGAIRSAAVVLGGVANIPYRHRLVEEALVGRPPEEATWAEVEARAPVGAKPLSGTAYKLELLGPAIRDALALALASKPALIPPPPAAPAPTPRPTRKGG